MRLHQDQKLFCDILRATADYLAIKLEFVQKDYWISLVLQRLALSKYSKECIFKGGTSLSKAYGLIERFSEDVDIAVINNDKKTGNEIKNIIRNIEKEITIDLNELQVDGISSKGSKFRKSVFEYDKIQGYNLDNKLIIEINSFCNSSVFESRIIRTMVFSFLQQSGNEKYIEQYNLQPFELNVLSKEETLLEKLISLIRFSFDDNISESLGSKIRHFYDLYYLMQDQVCIKFISSNSFKKRFNDVLNNDRDIFQQPDGWQHKLVNESALINNFENIWKTLKEKYNSELSALSYKKIPNEKDIANNFEILIKKINGVPNINT